MRPRQVYTFEGPWKRPRPPVDGMRAAPLRLPSRGIAIGQHRLATTSTSVIDPRRTLRLGVVVSVEECRHTGNSLRRRATRVRRSDWQHLATQVAIVDRTALPTYGQLYAP